MDLVSIVIVNYDGKKWLKKCLDSLFSQTYKDFEIIFVNNASTDDSVAFVKEHYPQVILVETGKNLGFAGGNNAGISQARGKYILLLNTDTWCETDFLAKVKSGFHESGCDVFGVTETEYENPRYREYAMSIDPLGYFVALEKSSDESSLFYISGACLFFPKVLYLETGGLDDDFFMYCEEVDWFWRLHLLGKKIHQAKNIYVYHAGSGSIGRGVQYSTFLWRNENTLQMLLKNYAWYNLAWVLPLYCIQNIFEMTFFLVMLKPKMAYSYIQGWWFNIINFGKIMQKRKRVQEKRLVGDYAIMKKMYFGFGKLHHLLRFLNPERI